MAGPVSSALVRHAAVVAAAVDVAVAVAENSVADVGVAAANSVAVAVENLAVDNTVAHAALTLAVRLAGNDLLLEGLHAQSDAVPAAA